MFSPPVLLVMGYLLGILLGEWSGLPGWSSTPLALAAAGAALAALITRRPLWLCLALGLTGIAADKVAWRGRLDDGGIVDDAPWQVRARVIALPVSAYGTTEVTLLVNQLTRPKQSILLPIRLRLRVRGELLDPLLPGDTVQFSARVQRPRGFVNPGASPTDRQQAARGIFFEATLHEGAALCKLGDQPPEGHLLERTVGQWRVEMALAIDRTAAPAEAALLKSLVLGDRSDLTRAVSDEFRAVGVFHLLSVSGLHLAVATFMAFAGFAWLLLRIGLGRGHAVRRYAALLALPIVWGYTALTGAEIATLRAALVATLCLGSVLLARQSRFVVALAQALLILLCLSPLELFDPSLQLSFAAVFATSQLGPQLAAVPRRWFRPLLLLLRSSVAALWATIPIVLWHFSELQPAGLLSNLVLVPLGELLVLPLGFGGATLSLFWARLGDAVLFLAAHATLLLLWLVHQMAKVAPVFHLAQPTWLQLSFWMAGMLVVAAGIRHRRAWAAASLGLLIALQLVEAVARAHGSDLRATFLDVGQGDAAVIELPSGHVMVIDGGGSFDEGFDPGERVVAPFLWRRGIARIDLVVLSHPHPDHANGLPFLVNHFSVGEIWSNGQPSAQPGTVALLQAAKRHHIATPTPHPIELAGAQVEPLGPLNPLGEIGYHPERSENDNSLILQVAYQGRALLLVGDAEREAEADLCGRVHPIDVLKVGHHGSRTSSSAEFLSRAQPKLAVISVGVHNRWGFPHGEVLERYRAIGSRVLRTDLKGGITIVVNRRGELAVQ